MKARLGILVAAAGVLFVAAATVYFLEFRHPKEPANPETTSPSGISGNSTKEAEARQEPSMPTPPQNALDSFFARLQQRGASSEELDALRRQLLAMNPDQATALIRAFLETGRDIPTGQEFEIGPGGVLAGAPTFRTYLLDILGQIAKKGSSPVASAISRQILAEKKSSDEWALAMRNLAWAEPQSKPFLAAKMREMLTYSPWASDPSPGMLEAFDVIVYSADPSFIPDLANLMSNGPDALRRASAVALDRLSEMAPLEVMSYLNANPTQLADKPFMRVDYFAKADLSNPAQRTAVEAYLGRIDVTTAEKSKLLKALLTPGSFVSENLITTGPRPEDDNGVARLQQLNNILTQWKAQNRFPELRTEMTEVQQRIGQ